MLKKERTKVKQRPQKKRPRGRKTKLTEPPLKLQLKPSLTDQRQRQERLGIDVS